MDWYNELYAENAAWGGMDAPRGGQAMPRPIHPQDRQQGEWVGAFMDCVVEQRPYSVAHAIVARWLA